MKLYLHVLNHDEFGIPWHRCTLLWTNLISLEQNFVACWFWFTAILLEAPACTADEAVVVIVETLLREE